MFKRTLILTTALFGLFSFAPLPLTAQDEDTAVEESTKPSKKKKKAKKLPSPVVTAVKKVKKVKGRVNEKADYYIYLCSASWCGPCCREMPEIVETYKEIKKSGKVDIILFCHDKTQADAKAFVKKFDIKFMTVMSNDEDKVKKVPGFRAPGGIPHCIFVDRYGRHLTAGHPGNLISNWKALTIDKGEPEAPAEESTKEK